MQLGYVIHYVPSVAETVAFYEAAFGLRKRFVHESGNYAEMDTGTTTLAFAEEGYVRSHGVHFAPLRKTILSPGIEISFITENVWDAVAQAVAAGAHKMVPPETKPWGQVVAYVRDLNGALVELCSIVPS